MRVVVALALLALALVATGGEARAGDGVSGRQLLSGPTGCRDSNCAKVVKDNCSWLPEADLKCDSGEAYKVPLRNCFRRRISYISISVNGKCTRYANYGGEFVTKLRLKCGDIVTIWGSDRRAIKGDGSMACSDANSRTGGRYCKTCKYTATYKCPGAGKPGDKCRDAYGECDLPSVFDKYCKCPSNGFRDSYYVCRKSTGPCDDGAKCTGKDAKCPYSGYKNSTVVCRPSTGICDKAETCTGKSGECPADEYVPRDTVICRASAGPCDAPEYCYKGSCPKDRFQPNTKLCGRSRGECERDAYCTGSYAKCPANEYLKNTTVCRKSYGECDVPEYCTGKDYKCPNNGYAPKTKLCRPAYGKCDMAEYCTGDKPRCPADAFKPKTEMCREKKGDCDLADYCSGYGPGCEDRVVKKGEVCRKSAGPCDAAEMCDGYTKTCPKDFCVDYRKELTTPYCPVAAG